MKAAREPRLADPGRARAGRVATLVGHLGLIALIVNWFTWIAPPAVIPRAIPLAALSVPLLFPLRGLLHGRRYTHQWTSFLSMFYVAIGIDAWLNAAAGTAWLGATMVLLATLLFVGTVVYARYTASGGPSPAARAEADAEARLAAGTTTEEEASERATGRIER